MLKYDNNHHYTNDDKVHNCEYKLYHVHIFRMAEFPHPDDLYNYPSCNILRLYMLSIHHLNKKSMLIISAMIYSENNKVVITACSFNFCICLGA